MMKKTLATLLACTMAFSLLACGAPAEQPKAETKDDVVEEAAGSVALNVTTTYAGNDGNAQNYQDAVAAWEAASGNTVNDASGTAEETFKARVIADFEVGAEPDVLFYFNGNDSDPFVKAGKVVPIADIQAEYPEYASNMKDGMISASPADGVKYAVPMNGYWEGMFVNKAVLEEAGVAVPGADYTWDQFLADCQAIKDAGFTPIAASLAEVPHYWFEFVIYNQLTPANHCVLPGTVDDVNGQAWVNGLADIKDLYEKGYFPENTLSATDAETFQGFIDGNAAFLIDGSWKSGGIEEATDTIENFTVTFVPGKNERSATDIIGGLSSGWYITKKAWDDPSKRDAAVDFVMHMTTDESVSKFAGTSVTALNNGATIDTSALSPLAQDALVMLEASTGITGAVQDLVPADARTPIFADMGNLVTGGKEISDAVQEVLDLLAAQQ